MFIAWISAALAQSLTVTGTCPGTLDLEVTAVTPGGTTMLVASSAVGPGTLPGGLCEGLELGLLPPLSRAGPLVDGDGDGVVSLSRLVPPAVCRLHMVAVDLDACTASEPVAPDAAPLRCDGSFADISTPDDVLAYAGCEELDAVYLHMTSGVGAVHFPQLRSVRDYVYFHQNEGVGDVRLPALQSVGQYVYFHQNTDLARVDLGALRTVGEYLYFWENLELETVAMGALESVSESITVVGNGDLCFPERDWDAVCAEVSIDAPVCD